MSKYNMFSTREDWDKLYQVIEKLKDGKEIVKKFKKMTSYDGAVTMYALLTEDYKLEGLK